MAPGTHILIGWWTANVLPLSRRGRLLVFLGGVLPDLDGLGMFYSWDAYVTYHHVLCHNLLGCILWTAAVVVLAETRVQAAALAFLNWHLHLAGDYFGSRGPAGSPPWILPYAYPFVGEWFGDEYTGPAWYFNPWQWPLNAWPNVVITLLAFAGWVYIAVRLNRTCFEFVWPRGDAELCRTLQRWFGAEPAADVPAPAGEGERQWQGTEGRVIRRSYLAVSVAVLLACAVAASQAR